MTRNEHLEYAKRRALAYADRGDAMGAWASMTSDMMSHPELAGHQALQLGTMMITGQLSEPGAMRDFINGFN